MGDTGSMAIGGALAGFAIMTKTEFLLLLVGGIFLIEALSVIVQVGSFKYWGRRVFLMTPIHHHFEMKAWSETKIMVRFWIFTAILCACGFALYYRYYFRFFRAADDGARARRRAARGRARAGRRRGRDRGRPAAARLEELEARDARPARLLPDRRRPVICRCPTARSTRCSVKASRRSCAASSAGMKRAVVLGMARSGQAAAALLERNGVEVVRVDRELGNDEDVSLLEGADVLVKSPGVPALERARRGRAIPIWSEVELAAHYLPNPILGVTGTNGKTTTSSGSARCSAPRARGRGRGQRRAGDRRRRGAARRLDRLRALELPARGRPRAPPAGRRADQPRARPPRPPRDLRGVPRREAADLREPGRGGHRGRAARVRGAGQGRRVEFTADDPLPAEPGLPGAHNRENAAAATAAARAAGLSDEAIAEALRSFPGVAHRLELVAELGGVRFVNDSKATNTAAARRALAAYGEPLHVILGGSRKGESFDELAREVHGRAYLIGETAGELADALDRAGVPFVQCGDLPTAVAAAAAAARPGEIVLLSPACASYDQFDDFEQRGEEFRRLVQNLSG